ncbi:hypothetical protein Ade02nite_49650 [Paractinoplanes deccanensis]|uniref:Uncharacterized protein n=1 Tax=Paractinoplanes deccanensis TaxID=113561 RepID=A0ABQ3Y8L2_9ACTN|nr:LytR C-terminal domain-containing protein [Actinoplanes deccanensis]GID76324.1 hypothetical protein Ade02nite_49650 [Actinoplanes deccanensis]
MPRTVPERLRELEAEVRDLDVLPAAAIRARGRSRRRRQLAVTTTAAAVVAATAGVAFAWPEQKRDAPPLPAAAPTVRCVLTLPSDPSQIKIRISGAAETAAQLRARRFTVLQGPTEPASSGAAMLVYGPAAIGTATVARASLHGEVTMRFDPRRGDDVIDLSLGPAFTRLATTTELNTNLATGGEPTAPPECS